MLQLSYVRMSTPVRSKICDHLQCFEASSWFQINEQTPQWACPVCERVLTIDQLFVDGSVPPSSRSTCSFSFDVLTLCFSRFFSYTDGIIKDCPDSVDDVLVEPNGDWHTTDKKYGTPSWLASNPLGPPAVPIVQEPTPNDDGENGNAKPTAIFTLSSDDEDGGRASAGPNAAVSRPSSSLAPQDHGAGGGGKGKGREVQQEPIDLTLSSDEEDDASPQPSAPRLSGGSQPNPLKRNATDAGSLSGSEGPEKKGRLGEYGE
jgi:E3 SUMO-protein ligase PIAS1